MMLRFKFERRPNRIAFTWRRLGVGGIVAALMTLGSSGSRADADSLESFSALNKPECAVHSLVYCARSERRPRKRNTISRRAKTALLKSALAAPAPQRPGTVDLYTIGIAGWSGEDVFIKELRGALATLGGILPIDDRVVRLINHRSSMRTIPLASRGNLAAAVNAVGRIMDKDEDVLILFMTSHGNPGGFGMRLPRRPPVELPARVLARMLDSAGIRHRLIIVSACYSGTFVTPLANDDTIVMTASDAHNPSFGCEPGREWTYFGDALFNRSLRPGVELPEAFAKARTLISEWESKDKLNPSNPQAHFGPALMKRLAPFFAVKPE